MNACLQQMGLHLQGCEPGIPTAPERAPGLYRHCWLVPVKEPAKGARAETALSTQALQHFKLKDNDYTPSYFTLEWASDASAIQRQRNALDSKLTHPKDAEPYPGNVGLIPSGCQTSVRAASLLLLKRRVSLWQQDHSFRNNTNYRTRSLRSRKK